eukprot:SAG11_NODE_18909_length_478_cov_1.467018_1_plen_34_part_10
MVFEALVGPPFYLPVEPQHSLTEDARSIVCRGGA